MKPLLSGLDTVECAYFLRSGQGSKLDFERLAQVREGMRASKRREPVVIDIGGKEFLLANHGTASGYPYLMENAEASIQFGEFNDPGFFVTYRSQALWHKGIEQLHQEFCAWASDLGLTAVREEGLSRVDFTIDFLVPEVDFDEDSFVTLATKDAQHRRDRRIQTFRFGEGDIVLRVYDKTAEIRESSAKTWFYPLWGGQTEGVWRIEFQIRKDVLRRFGIRTFEDLFDGYGDLLQYLTESHTTLRIPQSDSNRSRWPLHPLWKGLQAHVCTLPMRGVVRAFDHETYLSERLLRIAVSVEGYLKHVAAIEGLRNSFEAPGHDRSIAILGQLLKFVHDPIAWREGVRQRSERMRLGQW